MGIVIPKLVKMGEFGVKSGMVKKDLAKTIYSEIFPARLSKSDRRRLEIIDGAIRAFAGVDYDSVSFDEIGESVGASRRLVQHYFPNKEELFLLAMKSIRAQFQVLAVGRFSKAKSPVDQLKEYVRSTFDWIEKEPVHVRAWFVYFVVCTKNKKLRSAHAELTKMGEDRIAGLISAAHADSQISKGELSYMAKTIQRLITGGILEAASERELPELGKVREQVVRTCLAVAGLSA